MALTDCLTEAGLNVPEFSLKLQKELHALGMPTRASVKNPVDFGASGEFLAVDFPMSLGRAILSSNEVDALILHGIGRPGMHSEDTTEDWKIFLEIEKQQVASIRTLEKEFGLPVLIASHYNQWESQAVSDLNKQGVRIYSRLHEVAWLLSSMVEFGVTRK